MPYSLNMNLLGTIPNEIRTWITEGLKVSVTEPKEIHGHSEILPGEDFSFTLSVANRERLPREGLHGPNFLGVRLMNVRLRVFLAPGASRQNAKLYVPENPLACNNLGRIFPPLTPGTEVDEMYLFPARDDPTSMYCLEHDYEETTGAGTVKSLTLRGKAYRRGAIAIKCVVYADPDLEHLFPRNESSNEASCEGTVRAERRREKAA